MKTIIISLNLIFLGLINTFAQQMPVPPNPPEVTTTSSTSYTNTTTVDGNPSSNTSIARTNTKNTYKFKAQFSDKKTEEIKTIITTKMGTKNLSITNNKNLWIAKSNNKEVYKISLTKGKVNMYIDKEIASLSLIKKFENIGVLIKASLSS